METWNGSMISCITRYVFQSRNNSMNSISKNNPYEGNKLNKYQKWKEETIFFLTITQNSFFIFFSISIRRRLKDEKIRVH